MVNVLHVSAFKDNYIWLIPGKSGDMVIVDPGDADPVVRFLHQKRLRPAAILCTHHHHDHVGGIEKLVEYYDVPVYAPAKDNIPHVTHTVEPGDRVEIPGLGFSFEVLNTPGHTLGHIAYYGSDILLCGDTLFSAGCGRLFEGTPEQMHRSLSCLASLPLHTRLYCAHEYTEANLRFALTVEPDNTDAREHLERVCSWRAQGKPSLPSSIELELRINPFLRVTEPSVLLAAEAHFGGPLGSAAETFSVLRRWKDGFQG